MAALEVCDGQLVAVHRGAAAATHADRLAAVAGPGAPVVLAHSGAGVDTELVVTVLPPLRAEGLRRNDVAAAIGRLADVLARAHAAGIVHGPIQAEHIQGAPDAVMLGGWDEPGGGSPADDVVELGRLLARLGGQDPDLRALAARAEAPDRPSAAALAAALRACAAPAAPRPRGSLDRRFAGAGIGVLLAAIVTITLVSSRTSASTTRPHAAAAPPTTMQLGNDVVRDGQRLRIGRPGDVVVEGRFDCRTAAPAILRPSTGQVWQFPSWHSSLGRLIASERGATALGVRRRGDCDRLELRDGQGRWSALG